MWKYKQIKQTEDGGLWDVCTDCRPVCLSGSFTEKKKKPRGAEDFCTTMSFRFSLTFKNNSTNKNLPLAEHENKTNKVYTVDPYTYMKKIKAAKSTSLFFALNMFLLLCTVYIDLSFSQTIIRSHNNTMGNQFVDLLNISEANIDVRTQKKKEEKKLFFLKPWLKGYSLMRNKNKEQKTSRLTGSTVQFHSHSQHSFHSSNQNPTWFVCVPCRHAGWDWKLSCFKVVNVNMKLIA